MQPKPVKKCLECSLFFDSGNFCAQLNGQELSDLSEHSKPGSIKRGQSLGAESISRWPIIGVTSGVLSMQHLLEDGRKTIAALFMRGDIIDLRAISSRNHGNIVALSKAGFCRLSPTIFEQIVLSNPDAQRMVWDNLREQTFRAIDHSADLAKKQALEKLASFIFECRNRQIDAKDDTQVEIPIRRCDLAEYLGMQPETVSRSFHELEDRGILIPNSLSSVSIENMPALRRIANGDRDASGVDNKKSPNIKIMSFG